MELQLAVKDARPTGRSTPPHRHGTDAKSVPNYFRPSTGSCHHACKYGGTHTFEDKEAPTKAQLKPHRKPPPVTDSQNRMLVKVRSVFRRRGRDLNKAEKPEKAATANEEKKGESVEWKDIAAYDTVQPHGLRKVTAEVRGSGHDARKKDVTRGNKSYDKTKIGGQVDGLKGENESLDKKVTKSVGSKPTRKVSAEPPPKNMNTDTKSVKPPKGKKPMVSLVEKKAFDQEMVHGYQTLSPSLLQGRTTLLRDLEEEMVHEATNVKEGNAAYSLDQDEYAAVAAVQSSKPIPAHRRVKSMSINGQSVQLPFARQGSKNSVAFKLRSRSSRAPILPSEEEKPARLKSRRGEDPSGGGRGIQLRIRSLRRRGVGGSGGASASFVVPAVALRHQKTLEKKRSQRLYNNLIEETASKLVKARKSRVEALVGAFESVISKIAM